MNRPRTPQRRIQSPRRSPVPRHRSVLAPVVGVVVGALVVAAGWVGPTPASAQPGGVDNLTSGPKQVRVTVDQLNPKLIKADSTITATGTLTNVSAHKVTSPQIRLQTGTPLTDRSQLTANPPPEAGAYSCTFKDLPHDLVPGQSQNYTVSCPASTLGLTATGVYPLTVNVNGTLFDGTTARVGEADTSLPFFTQKPAAPTKVSWLWPIIDRPHQFTPGLLYGASHRLPSGVFRDDALASSLKATGRLGRLVSTALFAPKDVQLTIVLDPELISEVAAMRSSYQVANGSATVAGTGSRAARDWLTRLERLTKRPGVTVDVLPYADPDLLALADGPVGLSARIGPAYEQGLSAIRKIMPINNPLALAWPADGQLDNNTLYTLAGQSLAGVVASSDSLPLTQSQTPTPNAAASIPAQGTTLRAVVPDSQLGKVVGIPRLTKGLRLSEQEFMSELAMITAEAPSNARSIVIAPPRRWATSPSYLKAMLEDSTSLPWAQSTSVSDTLAAPITAQRGALQHPANASRNQVTQTQLSTLSGDLGSLNSFSSTLSNQDADTLLTPYYKAILTASSSAWRSDQPLGESFLRDLGQAIAGLQSRVYVVAPSTKQRSYTLASSSSPLVLTVANTFNVPVKVLVQVIPRGSAGFRASSVPVTIAPNSRQTVKVPAHVERSGSFSVMAGITTPQGSGQVLGQQVQLKVRSTAYGVVTLGITGGAFALLLLLVMLRLYRRIRASRRPPEPHDPSVEYPTGEYPTLTRHRSDAAS